MKRCRNGGIKKRCGCQRKLWTKCAHPWHAGYHHAGHEHRISLDKLAGTADDAATKTGALALLDRFRTMVRAGECPCAGCVKRRPAAPATLVTPDGLTFAAYGDIFLKACPKRRGKHKGQPRDPNGSEASLLRRLAELPGADGEPLKSRAIGSITQVDLERALSRVRDAGRAASTRNKFLVMARLLSSWGQRKGYLSRSWLTDDAEDAPVLQRAAGVKRHRRVDDEEERALLRHATDGLQRLVIAAIETGCRQGELLGLQWADVALERKEQELTIRTSKTGAGRTVPISPRLRAVLELLRNDPAGEPHAPNVYVFGHVGAGRPGFPQKAWETAVLKAHNVTPAWTPNNALTPESREALRRIDLTFHDLRHEAGSRMMQAGWPLFHIQQMLGHSNIAQTSTYLNATRAGLHDSMRRFGTSQETIRTSVAHESAVDQRPVRESADAPAPQLTIN
jgi:integrase